MTPRLVVFPVLALGLLLGAEAIAQIGPPGRPQLATQGAPPPPAPPPPTTARAAASRFPASYDATCLEDATDGEDDTPSTIAWVANDGSTGSTGSFDDPYDIDIDLLGLRTSDNANKEDLWGDGVRTVCWKKVTSNYREIDESDDRACWNQGPLISGAPTTALVNFAYPAAPLHTSSDAEFETTTLFEGHNGITCDNVDVNHSASRDPGAWHGFRFGRLGTTTESYWNSYPQCNNNDCNGVKALAVNVSWNYFASTRDSEKSYTEGNDAAVRADSTRGAVVEHNYFAQPTLTNGPRGNGKAALVRSFDSIGLTIRNNTAVMCPPDNERGWDFAHGKRDDDDYTLAKNELYVTNTCSMGMGLGIFQGAGTDKDADVGMWERNVAFDNALPNTEDSRVFRFYFGSDDQTVRYNYAYRFTFFLENGGNDYQSCDGNNADVWQNVNVRGDSNMLVDIRRQMFRWWSHINNQFLSLNDNGIWFADETLDTYIRESHRITSGTYVNCGGATPVWINASSPTTAAGIANLNALSYASGNDDSDPRMVCQYQGNNKCDGGTVSAPDDLRFCTGINTPVSGCPGASPHVDGNGIAQIGPYQGENMNDHPSTYTVQIGAGWLPPASHR